MQDSKPYHSSAAPGSLALSPRRSHALRRTSRLILSVLLLSSMRAGAMSVDQYLKVRRQSRCDLQLSYAQVHEASSRYSGRVFEMRGSANGFVSREADI